MRAEAVETKQTEVVLHLSEEEASALMAILLCVRWDNDNKIHQVAVTMFNLLSIEGIMAMDRLSRAMELSFEPR